MSIMAVINGRRYNRQAVRLGNVPNEGTPFEKNIIRFCSAWLTGQEHFTIKTSGSTSKPKKIVLTRKQLITSAQRIKGIINMKEGYNALVCLNPLFIASQIMLVRCMISNMQIYAVTACANPLQNIPADLPIHLASFTPHQLITILDSDQRQRLDLLDYALIGGAPVTTTLQKKIGHTPCKLYETYGMTETASAIALKAMNEEKNSYYFQCLPGIRIACNQEGCLVIEAENFNNQIITNDLIEQKGEQQFRWLGRKDNIINSGGIKIVPEQIEQQLTKILSHLNIHRRFFVTHIPHPTLGSEACLVIEGNKLDESQKKKINSMSKDTMERYTIPHAIMYITHFKYTESGKLDRNKTIRQPNLTTTNKFLA